MAVSLELFPALPSALALEFEEGRARLTHEVRRPGVPHEVRGDALRLARRRRRLEEL